MWIEVATIEVDLSNAWEKAFAEWYSCNRQDTKAALLCGYFVLSQGLSHYGQASQSKMNEGCQRELAAKTQEVQRLQQCLDKLESAQILSMRRDYDARLERAAAEAAELQKRLLEVRSEVREAAREQARVLLLEKELEMATRLRTVEMDLARYQHMYADMQQALHGTLAKSSSAQEEVFRKRIDALEMELSIAKKSNAGKGNLGEFAMVSWLREKFPAMEVVDTSGQPASCDIALRVMDASFLAVEVKNKANIVPDDLKKFYRDVDSMVVQEAGRFLGAAFVSLRSRGIPTKGSLHFEVHRGRPLLFISFTSEEEAFDDGGILLKSILGILIQAAGHLMDTSMNGDKSLQDLCSRLVPLCSRIGRLRKDIDRIRDSAKDIIKVSTGLAEEVSSILATMQEMAREGGSCKTLNPSSGPLNKATRAAQTTMTKKQDTGKDMNVCKECQRTFATPKGLAQHMQRSHKAEDKFLV